MHYGRSGGYPAIEPGGLLHVPPTADHYMMELDGVGDYLLATGLQETYDSGANWSVGMLIDAPVAGDYLMVWNNSAISSLNQIRFSTASSGGSTRPRFTIRDDITTVVDILPSSGPDLADGSPHWFWIIYNNGSVSCYWDRDTVAYGTGSHTRANFTANLDVAAVGSYYNLASPSNSLDGKFYQLMVWRKTLTEAERLLAHDTYTNRWKTNPDHLYLFGDLGSDVLDRGRTGTTRVNLTPSGGLALSDIAPEKLRLSA